MGGSINNKPCVIDFSANHTQRYRYPITGHVHIEIVENTPARSIHPCTMKIVMHQLLDEGAISDATRVTFISIKRLPAPKLKTVVTIIPQDT